MTFPTFLLLLATILSMSAVNLFKKQFKKPTPVFFSCVSSAFTLLFFIVLFLVQNGFKLSVVNGLLAYSIPYGICFLFSCLFSLKAVKEGDLSLTGLFISFSLIIPTLYGIITLGDKPTLFFWIGLVLFFVCLILTNVKFLDKNDKKVRKPVTLKWVIFVTIAAVANGCSSIFQTAQQKAYDGKYGNELMIVSLTIVCATFLIVSLITEREHISVAKKDAFIWGALAGIVTGVLNLLVIIFTGQNLLPVSIFFPVISGGNLIVTFIFGFAFYKEKYSWLQYVGILCGLASVVLLNI